MIREIEAVSYESKSIFGLEPNSLSFIVPDMQKQKIRVGRVFKNSPRTVI